MSHSHGPHRPIFPFGNPFRLILPKGLSVPPNLLSLLSAFEESLIDRLKKLEPKNENDILTLSWMKFATESLCETHVSIKSLITELELPVSYWDDKWIDLYLDNSIKLLDICIAFTSEISRLNQSNLLLQYVLHKFDSAQSNQLIPAQSSLDKWNHHISTKNPRLEGCFSILDELMNTLNLPKVKKSDKEKVLMRAMYGVKVHTVFICNVFAATVMGSTRKIVDIEVQDTYIWARSFTDLQGLVNGKIRSLFSSGVIVLKEFEEVDDTVKKLYPLVQDGSKPVEVESFRRNVSDLEKHVTKFSSGLDLVAKEFDDFFQIILSGRDALLCNLRIGFDAFDPILKNGNVDEQAVR
jgi:hypothetical protein